jgi:hypothetical protein
MLDNQGLKFTDEGLAAVVASVLKSPVRPSVLTLDGDMTATRHPV